MAENRILFTNAHLVQVRPPVARRVNGREMGDLPAIENGFMLVRDGRIEKIGPMQDKPELQGDTEEKDVGGRMIFPCWVDSHTHIVYAGSREQEFVDRIKGLSYEEIAKKGGGILNSADRLQKTSEDELYEHALARLEEVIGYGTGGIEIKSGYGLSTAAELKILRVIRRLKEASPIPVKATFLGAHAIPKKYRENRGEYIRILKEEMLTEIAREGLADYCDVFCDRGFFTPEETRDILEAAADHGLRAKIHANELDYSGGVQVGVQMDALSVDHLECVGEAEIEALKNSDTIPTLLPSTAFFLNLEYAPARKMIEADLPVTLASDYNPGSTPSGRMPFVLSLACIKMRMLPEEAINAATLNGAAAIELEGELGSLSPGKLANFFITKDIPSIAFLPYAFGSDLIEQVYINGEPFDGLTV